HDSRSVASGGQGRRVVDHRARLAPAPGRRHDRHLPPHQRHRQRRAVPAVARRMARAHWPHRGPAREAEADRGAGPRQEQRALAPLVGTRVGRPVGRDRERRGRNPQRRGAQAGATAVQPHRRARLPLDRPGGRGRPGGRPGAVRDQHRAPLEPQRIPRRRPRHPCPRPDQPGGAGLPDRDELGGDYYETIGPNTLSTTTTIETTNGHAPGSAERLNHTAPHPETSAAPDLSTLKGLIRVTLDSHRWVWRGRHLVGIATDGTQRYLRGFRGCQHETITDWVTALRVMHVDGTPPAQATITSLLRAVEVVAKRRAEPDLATSGPELDLGEDEPEFRAG